MKEIELTIETKHLKLISLAGILLAILLVEIIYPWNTPINFGDEGYHTILIQWFSNKKELPVWTPYFSTELIKGGITGAYLYHLATAGLMLFGFQEALVRFIVPFCAILSGLAVFVLGKKIFNENVGWFAAILLVTFPSFVTYSVFLYRDAFFTFFLTVFFLTFILAIKENSKKYWLLSGVFAAFTIFSKTAGFGLLFFVGFVFLYEIFTEKNFFQIFKKYLIWFAIVVSILALPYLRNIYYFKSFCYYPYYPSFFDKIPLLNNKGCSVDLYEEKYQFAGRVEQVGTEANVFAMGLTSYLEFAYGNLFITFFPFLAGVFLLYFLKRKTDVLILLILLSLIPIFYVSVGRAEDTARYTLGWAPIIALVAGVWFDEVNKFLNKYYKYLGAIVFLIVLVYSIWGLRFLGISGYGFLDRLNVLLQVRRFSSLFFDACKWVRENLPENVRLMTIWCYRAVYNCERNAVGNYPDIALSKDLNTTLQAAKANGITHIFIQKFSIDPANKHYSENYDLEFVQFLEANPKNFVKVYENGPSLQECQLYWQRGLPCDGNIIYEIRW
ncbi:MAG: glycosyltransferase family 39 protein [Candidatus Aenigmarchaeota archaeon]|nr:glycosyltransferase family 39 protein [Candidatus Aenigmarchaeota archaeon]